MAPRDDRTEKATPKRRGEAREQGQVAKSPDLNSISGLVAAFAALMIGGPRMVSQLEALVTQGLVQSGNPQLATKAGIGSLTLVGAARVRASRWRRS